MTKFPPMRNDLFFLCAACKHVRPAKEFGTRQKRKGDDVRRCRACTQPEIAQPIPAANNEALAYMRTPEAFREEMKNRGEERCLWELYPHYYHLLRHGYSRNRR